MIDKIKYTAPNGRKSIRYRSYCLTCKKDKGYVRKRRLNKDCHSCNSTKMAIVGATHNGKSDIVKRQNSDLSSKMNSVWWEKRRVNRYYCSKEHKQVRQRFSCIVRQRLKKRGTSKEGNSVFELTGYSIEELMTHLESKFYANSITGENMSWENYGYWGWHIDHIKPDSRFEYKSPYDKEFKDSWSLSNLQPLWRMENIKKGAKYDL